MVRVGACRAAEFCTTRLGVGYTATRQTDRRIAERIWSALSDARTVLNVGAGTGSYEPVDREVVAIEPSAAMLAQRPTNAAPAIQGEAEALPFEDGAFDATMAVLSDHHWRDRSRTDRPVLGADASYALVNGTFVDYTIPSAADLPSFVTDRTESPATSNCATTSSSSTSRCLPSAQATATVADSQVRHLGTLGGRWPTPTRQATWGLWRWPADAAADYREHLAKVLTGRAVLAAAG